MELFRPRVACRCGLEAHVARADKERTQCCREPATSQLPTTGTDKLKARCDARSCMRSRSRLQGATTGPARHGASRPRIDPEVTVWPADNRQKPGKKKPAGCVADRL